jgi:hypothetical protein
MDTVRISINRRKSNSSYPRSSAGGNPEKQLQSRSDTSDAQIENLNTNEPLCYAVAKKPLDLA